MIGIPLALVTMADAGKFLSKFVLDFFEEVFSVFFSIFELETADRCLLMFKDQRLIERSASNGMEGFLLIGICNECRSVDQRPVLVSDWSSISFRSSYLDRNLSH